MVRGSPRHSQSNGGVERVNQTVQEKLGAWMRDSKSRCWSVGCQLVMFRYNTQQHRTIGDIPYRLVFGQLPRVGISSLHLERSFIETLATEAQLNRVVQYEGMVDVIDSDEDDLGGEVEESSTIMDSAIPDESNVDNSLTTTLTIINKCQRAVKCHWGIEGLCNHEHYRFLFCSDATCENTVHPHCQKEWEEWVKISCCEDVFCPIHHPNFPVAVVTSPDMNRTEQLKKLGTYYTT